MRIASCIATMSLLIGTACAENPDLSGRVVTSDESALEGTTVYVWTASVKEGTSSYCPSCYPDCGKKAVSDQDGRFTIPSLDSTLRFRVLAVKEGYLPTFVEQVDPAEGDIMFVLGEIAEDRLDANHQVLGRVVDPDGHPIVGAIVEPFGMKIPRGSSYGGESRLGVDPLAVTNERGEFTLTLGKPNATLYAHVSARDFAVTNVHTLSTGGEVHEITLNRGVTIAGYVRDDGQGLGNVEVGIVQTDRNSHTFLGDYSVGTFDTGYFELPNMQANTEYFIYGMMESLRGKGAIPARKITTGDHGERMDCGSLDIELGFSIQGQVVLSDGGTIPPKTRLSIGRDDAWDALMCELDEDGRFAASDLPSGAYGINVRVDGYRMSEKNYSLDPLNKFGLMGVITSDIENLTILLEPGKADPNSHGPDAGERYQQLTGEEIRGWEKE